MRAALGEGLDMVELEELCFPAALSPIVDVRAAAAIAFEDAAAHFCRNTAAVLARRVAFLARVCRGIVLRVVSRPC